MRYSYPPLEGGSNSAAAEFGVGPPKVPARLSTARAVEARDGYLRCPTPKSARLCSQISTLPQGEGQSFTPLPASPVLRQCRDGAQRSVPTTRLRNSEF